MHTLATLMRQQRFAASFRDSIIQVLGQKLQIRHERRPEENIARSKRLMDLLFGGAPTKRTCTAPELMAKRGLGASCKTSTI